MRLNSIHRCGDLWLGRPPLMRDIEGSSHGRVKPNTIQLELDTSSLGAQY